MENHVARFCKTHLPTWAAKPLRFAKSTSLYTKNMPRYAMRRALARNKAARTIRCVGPPVPVVPHEIRAFMVVRNESLRLPFILDQYFARGVDRFFLIDNNSSDDTASIIESKKNAHLFFTDDAYVNQGYWIDLLLRRYGIGHWCLIVDADEVFVYPHYETIPLRELCVFLDQRSFNCLDCVLLDMYPDVPLSQAEYKMGTDPLMVASWFDKPSFQKAFLKPAYIDESNVYYKGPERLFGGMRERVFCVNACVSKFPLVKFDKSLFLSSGTHFMQGGRAADMRGALLHFKFLQDFASNVEREVAREQHYQNATEYKRYLSRAEYSWKSSLKGPLSARYTDSNQLVGLGIMRSSAEFDMLAQTAQPAALQSPGKLHRA
jgi:Glycosyl transferase family 2